MKQKIFGEKDQNWIFKKKEDNYYFPTFDGDPLNFCSFNRKDRATEGFSIIKNEKNDIFDNAINIKDNNKNNNKKDEFMEMINSQDFIEGYWEQNEHTKVIIEKYEKEYKLIKGLKNKNIDDKTAITILVIYFIYKEHSNSLNDLLMIIKKSKKFIKKAANDSYENIIKEANIN